MKRRQKEDVVCSHFLFFSLPQLPFLFSIQLPCFGGSGTSEDRNGRKDEEE